ncbi:hypothetical protein ACJX0J_032834, partial [Zea mays]
NNKVFAASTFEKMNGQYMRKSIIFQPVVFLVILVYCLLSAVNINFSLNIVFLIWTYHHLDTAISVAIIEGDLQIVGILEYLGHFTNMFYINLIQHMIQNRPKKLNVLAYITLGFRLGGTGRGQTAKA